jgi:hypothetical protein
VSDNSKWEKDLKGKYLHVILNGKNGVENPNTNEDPGGGFGGTDPQDPYGWFAPDQAQVSWLRQQLDGADPTPETVRAIYDQEVSRIREWDPGAGIPSDLAHPDAMAYWMAKILREGKLR